MAVAFDASTGYSAEFTTTSPADQSHTPSGTPRAVVVRIAHPSTSNDLITGVTYGGVAMERVASVPNTGSGARSYIYFLGENVPTGTQTASISHTGTSDPKWAGITTFTASTDVSAAPGQQLGASLDDPFLVFQKGDRTGMGVFAEWVNFTSPASQTPGANMTGDLTHDFGATSARFDYQTTPSNGLTIFQYTQGGGQPTAFCGVSLVERTGGAAILGGACQWTNDTTPVVTSTTTAALEMTGQLDGKDLYMSAMSRDHTSGTALATCTDNSGANTWTLVSNDTDRKQYVWWKLGSAADVGATVTVAGAVGSLSMGLIVVEGTDGANGDPTVDFSLESNAAGDETHAGFTPSVADAPIVFGVGNYGSGDVVTLLAAATLGTLEPEFFRIFSSGGSDSALTVTGRTNSGTTATGNFTWSQTNRTTKSFAFAVTPEADDDITGSGSSTLEDVTSAGSGAIGVNGSGSSTLAHVTSAGSGTFTPPAITGTGASTLANVTSAGAGAVGTNGAGASTLADITSAGTGTYTPPPITGSGASTLDDVTSSGTGTFQSAVPLDNVTCSVIAGLEGVCLVIAGLEATCEVRAGLVGTSSLLPGVTLSRVRVERSRRYSAQPAYP